ncbi:hypothetical protein N9U33_04390 [Candidatus Pelagibacter bacterium]|nr:hypothetical protein [Candidatus Pelagibacter bacterium]
MRSKIYISLFTFIFFSNTFAEELLIQAKNITLDKDKVTTIFENDVVVKTKNKTIKSQYVKYNKKIGLLILKKSIVAEDNENNVITSENAEFNENNGIFKTFGPTNIFTSENYKVKGRDITLNNQSKTISSNKLTTISDPEGNYIELQNFNYQVKNNIFQSIGSVKISDKHKNDYEFSQIYIDTKKKEILGTDIKAFLNEESLKVNPKNKPRVFANSIKLSTKKSTFSKSIFTICDYRENDKCPPWTIQASKMLHDNIKKTIYYDNALIKVYDIPIFYIPKLSHPDPTVDRRSGFLPPTLTNSKNLGTGISLPYFFDIGRDKNFTLTSKIFVDENPLILGEYHQAFLNSNFLADFGFTEGYKKTNSTKKSGEKSHFFSKFVKNFTGDDGSKNSFSLAIQDVSNDKYLKLYKINSNLVDYNKDTLENHINFTHERDDLFFGLNASIFETLKESYEDKYEYILPEITIDKNLLNNDRFGNLDLQTNISTHLYDTNKLKNFIVNDFDWRSKDIFLENGFNTKILGNLRNINYEVKNVDEYKEDTTSELFGALGLFSKISLLKKQSNSEHLLTPKFLLRYAPGSMRNETSGSRLTPSSAFNLNRLSNINNFETGISGTLGFDYKATTKGKEFDFSIAQVINDDENNKMPDKSSLNEKVSDLVGSTNLKLSKNFSLNYNFALDQNYQDLNFNELGVDMNFGPINFDFNYLQEKKHIGNQDYFTTKINLQNKDQGTFSFETKRNLITDSSEFYNLSYEYINDCLRAGLVYRREFYNDSELEPENSLMFKITLTPFGSINSPTFDK